MHSAIIIGTVRSLIVDMAMRQIPRSIERISSFLSFHLREACTGDEIIAQTINMKFQRNRPVVSFVSAVYVIRRFVLLQFVRIRHVEVHA